MPLKTLLQKRLSQKVEAFFYNRILYCFDYHVSETFKHPFRLKKRL